MISFFRRIRKSLSDEGKTGKYLKYALGEVLLIVVGILIALQLQNWNEQRQQEQRFRASLEQVYNTLASEIEGFDNGLEYLQSQANVLDSILISKDSLDPRQLIPALFYVTAPPEFGVYESRRAAEDLSYDPNKKVHRELARQISVYASRLVNPARNSRAFDMLQEAGIPLPQESQNLAQGLTIDPDQLEERDFQKLKRLLESDAFIPALKNLKIQFHFDYGRLYSWKTDAESLMKGIRNYYPEVRILYKNVSMIGPALEGWDIDGGRDFPLFETDLDRYIWETTLYLKEGEVKFRCRESWAQNWGGTGFPTGRAQKDGADIMIPEAGTYRVTLNLSEGTYGFELVEAE